MFFLLLLIQSHLAESSYFDTLIQSLCYVCDNKEYELRYDSRGKNPKPNKQTDPLQLLETVYKRLDQMMQTRMLHLRPNHESYPSNENSNQNSASGISIRLS